jgi:tRNA(Ile)-lysidine synthetase-like protein
MQVLLPKPGMYVIAVSGGVDSMVLLDILNKTGEYQLVVAHLDHGMRADSSVDRKLVEKVSSASGLEFVYKEVQLGSKASEAKARQVRYEFLRQVKSDIGARAIITAHHQDDVLETAIINMLRGTGRKGLTSLSSSNDIIRPLLLVPKTALLTYARTYVLKWREDTTNQDESYLRNYVRKQLLPHFSPKQRAELLNIIKDVRHTNDKLDALLAASLRQQAGDKELARAWFNNLPHEVAREVLAAWLRSNDIRNFDRSTLERLVVASKTASVGKVFSVMGGRNLEIKKNNLALTGLER